MKTKLTNREKIQKVNQQTALARKLFEEVYTREDYEAKKPEAIAFWKKCNLKAAKEIWYL